MIISINDYFMIPKVIIILTITVFLLHVKISVNSPCIITHMCLFDEVILNQSANKVFIALIYNFLQKNFNNIYLWYN